MKLGFDELYVVVEPGLILHNEVLYDSRTADEIIDWLKRNGALVTEKMSLEQYLERITNNF